ncbi:MAG: SWIM zinc finger family protein [Pseudomonadota bacterium]
MATKASKLIAAHGQSARANALCDAALLELAGAAVFARGQAYAGDDAVQDAELSYPNDGQEIALRATVEGTQQYSVEVVVTEGDDVQGDCDCPHAQDGYFCKHQVALALVLRGMLGGETPPSDPVAQKKLAASTQRAKAQANKRVSLQDFVKKQSAADLAQRLWAWAEADGDLMADLKAWAAQDQARDNPKALTEAITELLHSRREFLDWRECASYVHRAEKVLPLLEPWLKKDPVRLRELCDHALRCLFEVAEDADDSDGEIGDLMQRVMDLMLDALQAQPPEAAWLDCWFSLQQADPFGLWSERTVIDAAGPAVQAQFAKRAKQDWQDWAARHRAAASAPNIGKAVASRNRIAASMPIADRYDPERENLRRRYLDCVEREGDPLALIEAMRNSAERAHEFSNLVACCEKHGKLREAMEHALLAHQKFPDDWRVEADVLRCYERESCTEEALLIRRRQFEKTPDVEHYKAVLTAAKHADRDGVSYRAELFAWAEAQELKTRVSPSWGRQARPAGERDVSTRVGWLLAEKRVNDALALVQPPHRCSRELLRTLARKLPNSRNSDAVPLLLRVFAIAMPNASSPYADVLAIVKETMARMEPQPRAQWLAYLRAEYKAKRNFIKELPTP